MKRLRIRKENLIVVAGVVWLVAGVNVAILGVRAAIHMSGAALLVALALAAGSIVIFCAFHAMFSRLVAKNSERIRGLEGERHNPLRFLDARSYATMAVMMSIGFGMRAVGLIPEWFVAFFYTGLGLALALAGVSFLLHRAADQGWAFHARRR